MKKIITMNLPMRARLENARESGSARNFWRKVSLGMTWAVVLPSSAETGTMV